MFDSVLAHNIPRRQIGRGAILSFVIHAILIVAAVYISSRPPSAEKKDPRKVMLFNPPPPPPPPPPPGGGAVTKPKVEKKKVIKKPDTVIQTTKKDLTPEKPPEREKPPQEAPDPAGVEGGVQGGVAGGVVGGVVGGTGTVLPFGPGMSTPSWLSNPQPIYTKEAAAMRVEGKAIAKCIITVEGTLQNCRLVKGLPHMDQAILTALKEWRSTPVIFQGRPVSVGYIVYVKLVAP